MPQFNTDIVHNAGLPGHISTPDQETESIVSEDKPQVFTITAGSDPMADGDYNLNIAVPGLGTISLSTPFTSAGLSDDDWAAGFAAALAADGQFSSRYTIGHTAPSNTITLTAKSNLDVALPTFTQPAADAAIAQTQAAGGAALVMGVFYKPDALTTIGSVQQGNRRAVAVRSLEVGDTVDAITGVVAREVNSTTLDPLFNSGGTLDQYPAGQVAPGLKRHRIWMLAETDFIPGDDVYAVLNPGDYNQVGAVANAADAVPANTLLVSGPGNTLARAVSYSQNITMNGRSVKVVEIKVNRTQ